MVCLSLVVHVGGDREGPDGDSGARTWRSLRSHGSPTPHRFSPDDCRTLPHSPRRFEAAEMAVRISGDPRLGRAGISPGITPSPPKCSAYDRCVAPFIMLIVMPNGDVTTCRDFIDVVWATLPKSRFSKSGTMLRIVKFRKMLLDHGGLLPQCSRCCGAHGFFNELSGGMVWHSPPWNSIPVFGPGADGINGMRWRAVPLVFPAVKMWPDDYSMRFSERITV